MKLKNYLVIAAASAAMFAVAGAASAADFSDYNINAGVEVTSDRVERGLSRTDGVGYSADATVSRGNWFVGARAATADLYGADQQYDARVGYTREAYGVQWTGEIASQSYVGAIENLNTVEATVRAARAFGPVAATAEVSWSPDYLNHFGKSTWVAVGGSYDVTDVLTAEAGVGQQWVDGFDYTAAYVGATYKVTDKVGVNVRYTATEDAPSQYGDLFGDRVSVSLRLAL